MLPTPVMCTTGEAFFGITQSNQVEEIDIPEPPQPPPQDPKNPKPVEPVEPYVLKSQNDIIPKGFFVNKAENMKTLTDIVKETHEGDLFVL